MKLREYLRGTKIRYRDFAEKLGINEQTLRNIVAGSSSPSLLLALKIEELTNGEVTPAHLVDDFNTKKLVSKRK